MGYTTAVQCRRKRTGSASVHENSRILDSCNTAYSNSQIQIQSINPVAKQGRLEGSTKGSIGNCSRPITVSTQILVQIIVAWDPTQASLALNRGV